MLYLTWGRRKTMQTLSSSATKKRRPINLQCGNPSAICWQPVQKRSPNPWSSFPLTISSAYINRTSHRSSGKDPNLNRFSHQIYCLKLPTFSRHCVMLQQILLRPMLAHEISGIMRNLMTDLHVGHVVPVVKSGPILPFQHLIYLLLTTLCRDSSERLMLGRQDWGRRMFRIDNQLYAQAANVSL